MNTRGLRYTALRLATLHPADRAWLLERLPVAAADALRAIGTTPGLGRLAQVAATIEPPRMPSDATMPIPVAMPSRAVHELDPAWAALWTRASGSTQDGVPMPARLKAALASWVPPEDVDA
jgi:hypothetical protein